MNRKEVPNCAGRPIVAFLVRRRFAMLGLAAAAPVVGWLMRPGGGGAGGELRPVPELIAALERQPTWLSHLSERTWPLVPRAVAKRFPSLAPVSFNAIHEEACQDLGRHGTNAVVAVPALLRTMDISRPGWSVSVLRTIEEIGPPIRIVRAPLLKALERVARSEDVPFEPGILNRELLGMAGELRSPTTPVAAFVRSRLSPPTLAALAEVPFDPDAGFRFTQCLISDLNRIGEGPAIYDKDRFEGIGLRARTRRLLEQGGASATALNRRLLDDAFPSFLAAHAASRDCSIRGVLSPTPAGRLDIRTAAAIAGLLARIGPDDSAVRSVLLTEVEDQELPWATEGMEETIRRSADPLAAYRSACRVRASQRPGWLRALGRSKLASERKLEEFGKALTGQNSTAPSTALEELARMGEAARPWVPAVVSLLESPDAGEGEQDLLVSRVGAGSPVLASQLRHQALLTLQALGAAAAEAAPALARASADIENPLRFHAAYTRWRVDGNTEAVLPVLLSGLDRPHAPGEVYELDCLAAMAERHERAFDGLLSAVGSPDENVRRAALRRLMNFPHKPVGATPTLIQALADPAPLVRGLAALCLESYGTNAWEAGPALRRVLTDSDPVVQVRAGHALKAIQAR